MNMAWYNFRTETVDYIETPDDFSDYIPKISCAHNLYEAYIESGITPIDAYIRVVEFLTGNKEVNHEYRTERP